MQDRASIEDQVRVTGAFISGEGWDPVGSYCDEAISGADERRPDYQRLKADIEARKVDVVVVDEISRLWRNQREQYEFVDMARYLGVHVIGVNDGIDSRREGYEMLLAVRGAMNADFIRYVAKKVHNSLAGRAQKGLNAGGKVYGYRSVYQDGVDRRGQPTRIPAGREIDQDQARWVIWMFEQYAAGYSPRAIAADLNRRGVPSPRGGTWAASAIYGHPTKGTGVLNQDLYRGAYIWNRSQWVAIPPEVRRRRGLTGKKERRERPQGEWIRADLPALRIVPQDLWDRVKARQQAGQGGRGAAIRASGQAGQGGKYLFSGLLRCGCCGARYVVVDYYRYGCANHRDRGTCTNDRKVRRSVVEANLLAAIKQDLLSDAAMADFRAHVRALLAEAKRQQRPDDARRQERLVALQAEIGNMVGAIRAGAYSQALAKSLEVAEQEKARLEREAASAPLFDRTPDFIPRLNDIYRERVQSLEDVAQADMVRAQAALRDLVGDEIKLVPADDGDHLEAEIRGNYSGLLSLAVGSKLDVVAGVGFGRQLTTKVKLR